MQPVTSDTFGPLVAYLAPGATVLLGVSLFSPLVRSWFIAVPDGAPTIGGFLFLTVASIAVGMTVSAVRWLIVDTLHAWTGLPLPRLNFSRLDKNVAAFSLLIEIHYRHYLHYSNMGIATAFTYGCYRVKFWGTGFGWLDVVFVIIEVVFFAASRDTLRSRATTFAASSFCR
jgi:hypothetical protein